jgi:glycerol uptake facilitator-like aquaporin
MDKQLRAYLIELAGTFAFVFVSAGAVCATYYGEDATAVTPLIRSIYIALATGFILAAALTITLPYEGGFLNPAITLTLWVYKRMEGPKAAGLIFIQFLGAAIAGGLLRIILTNHAALGNPAVALGTPHLDSELSSYQLSQVLSGAAVEFCCTFVLTLVIFGTVVDPRAPRLLGPIGRWLSTLWIGLAMAAIVLVAFRLTGASANPARWFGTVVWEFTVDRLSQMHPFRDQLAYWVGPILGALVAGGVYNALLMPSEEDSAPAASTPPATGKSAAGSTLFRSKK